MAKSDITQFEILCLPEVFNLTDGHAHRSLDENERRIIDGLSQLFLETNREQQLQLEKEYVEAFYALFGQTMNEQASYLLLPSASLGIEIVANFLRLRGKSLALTEPCVDNIPNVFKRHDIRLESIPDFYLDSKELESFLRTLKSDAICIVSPNNPTGICYSKQNFEQVVRFCKRYKKLLILDTSFRAYRSTEKMFDEYQILHSSGVDYICIEDSGKTWPTKGFKVSILASSSNIRQPIYDIYTDFIYHHSSVTIKFVAEFIHNSTKDNLQSVLGIVNQNRQILRQALDGTFLEMVDEPNASVAWLRINSAISASKLQALLAADRVFILSGDQFFWNDKAKGSKFLRVALARDEPVFKAAVQKLRKVVLLLSQGDSAEAQ